MTRVGWCPGGRPVVDMLARYPTTRTVRVFVGARDPLPAWDGPILGPLVDGQVVVHLSFKTWDLPAVLAWAERKPAGLLLLLTYAHEPEQGKEAGDPTVEQFHARWGELVPAFDGHPARDDILLGPVYTRYWWQQMAGDLRWLVKVPVDFIGWDVYSSEPDRYRTPDDLLSIPRAIAARTKLPYLVAELGAVRIPGDDDGAGRTAWMRDMVAAARADGALAACWFHRLEWDLVPYAAEQQTWRELTQEDPMPTYTQLQAESWWGREVTTPAMDWLGDELCRRTGRPREAAGTKGDNRHLRGAHRSQEWIRKSVYCTNRSYTVQSGLTVEQERHIAGFDFTPGSAEDMVAQCKRLYAAMRAGQLDEVREFYGNVDGDQVVDGWDNVADRAASSDSSHLWHWHLSVDRRHCNNQALMERILAIALGEDPDMPLSKDDINAVASRVWSASWGLETAGGRLGEARDESRKARLASEAVLAAVKGLDTAKVLARIDQVAAEERQRDAETVQKLAELGELYRQGQSGELAADELLRRMGEVLTAGTAPQS